MSAKRQKNDDQIELDLWTNPSGPKAAAAAGPGKSPKKKSGTKTKAPDSATPNEPDASNEIKSEASACATVSRQVILRAALGFLAEQHPSGLAHRVPLHRSRPQVAAAAFWRDASHNGTLSRTVAVEIGESREQCFAKCAGSEERLTKLRELRLEKLRMEHFIREDEPELRCSDELFDDLQRWDFAKSRNRDYRRLLREMEAIQHAVYRGSRMEHIRRAAAADYLYLAVPENLLTPEELPVGWGLLYIRPDRKYRIVKVPDRQSCDQAKRLGLAVNIAEAMVQGVLFRYGIGLDADGKAFFSRIPHRRGRESE